jgi:hypothetical protein
MLNPAQSPADAHRMKRQQALVELGNQITELAAHLDAGEYRFLVLLEEFHREQAWQSLGIGSCAQWLNWRCGMSIGVAREKIRVARALPDLPRISKVFSEGRISYSKVRAMTRVATPKNESALLNVALHGTASHVEKQVQLYRRVKRIEALAKENERHQHRELTWRIDDDGYFILKGRFTPEQGTVIKRALEKAQEALWAQDRPEPGVPATEGEDKEPIAARRADALERVADSYLARQEKDRSGGDRYLVNLHTDIETLKENGSGAEAQLDDCCHVSAETSRRLACDAALVHWHESAAGEPLNVGRKTRTIPPAIRRALQQRDRGCRFPGCSCTRFVDAHHIRHWADGGETCMDNLVLLCRRHHRLVHEGGFGVASNDSGQVEFTRPDGAVLAQAPQPRSRGNVVELKRTHVRKGLRITPRTSIPRWHGEKMDHELAVLALVQKE